MLVSYSHRLTFILFIKWKCYQRMLAEKSKSSHTFSILNKWKSPGDRVIFLNSIWDDAVESCEYIFSIDLKNDILLKLEGCFGGSDHNNNVKCCMIHFEMTVSKITSWVANQLWVLLKKLIWMFLCPSLNQFINSLTLRFGVMKINTPS